jgi:predicted ABC-type transport system involved in lysophospholipase L1 biosynthesis ATPase subunit
MADDGRSVVVVTHETAVTDRADRILRLHDGRLEPA